MSEERFRSPFPDYDVLAKRDTPSWNQVTRDVVDKRLHHIPPRQFFNEHEWRTLQAISDRLIPQPDRPENPVPIVPWIDQKLYQHKSEGYRYADMPPMEQAWRKGLRGIDQESERLFARPFIDLPAAQQDQVLEAVQQGWVHGEAWSGMPAQKFFNSTLLSEVVSIYYAHPEAWSEIGFGGPASPRGYVRLEPGRTDHWEAKEHRDGESES